MKKQIRKLAAALLTAACAVTMCLPASGVIALAEGEAKEETVSAKDAVKSVTSYGFVDLEGAKLSAIIVEYDKEILASSVELDDYDIMDYAILQEEQNGFEKTVEVDGDEEAGNEGKAVRVYVNDEAVPSENGGKESGKYVIIEVNTDYMLTGQNLVYTTSMMAGITQKGEVSGKGFKVLPSEELIANYTAKEVEVNGWGGPHMETQITTDKKAIVLPEFGPESGWTLNYIGEGAFKATGCYSEYTGQYVDFEMPYSIYVPNKETLEKNKGHIALVIHMEHAGSNDTDPMAAITSSKAAVKLSSAAVQDKNPAIVVVPQIEESRRSTNDYDASSEANPAVWELMEYILEEYKDYIDTNRIYGTGQSMGGMTILYMASQRDNFFAGIAVIGAQWSNSYNKPFQNNGSPARSPENDKVSFNGFGLDAENYLNWYYMVSDDNIMVHTCAGDPMATGEWAALAEYFEAAGGSVSQDEWDPYLPLEEQYEKDKAMADVETTEPGTGILWGRFTRGNHMSTWKYGYQLDYPFEWLFAQTRETEEARGKLEQLKNDWLGRDEEGKILEGSGTNGLNAAQYTPGGANANFTEGWTPVGAVQKMIDTLPEDLAQVRDRDASTVISNFQALTEEEKQQLTGAKRIEELIALIQKANEEKQNENKGDKEGENKGNQEGGSGEKAEGEAAGTVSEEELEKLTADELYEKSNEARKNGDRATATLYEEAAAEKGHVEAAGKLSEANYNGNFGTPDYEKAWRFAQTAEAGGHPRGTLYYGIMLMNGKGSGKVDLEAGLAAVQKAVDAGDTKAPRYLGLAYLNGEAVEKNLEEAAKWFAVGSERGDITSKIELGKMYMAGEAVEQDYMKARELFLQTVGGRADHVNAEAMALLGEIYANGYGMAADKDAGIMWYQKALASDLDSTLVDGVKEALKALGVTE
ncbi:MAG: SEL1-like repeat protein [Lachnospiraceae bacterium]|nr:SEL1-like repeat protein [Lachnospiraceae bacterium]